MLKERILPPVSTGSSLPALTQRIRKSLPANTFIVVECGPSRFLQIHQVDDNVIGAQMPLQLVPRDAARADDDHFTVLQDLCEITFEQRPYMRNRLLNIFPIGPDETTERHVIVPDLDFSSFTQQMLDQLYLRALPQVVGGGLEAQPKNSDVFLSGVEHHFDGPLQVLVVARHDGFEERQFEVEFLGAIVEGTHIFGQTGAAKSEPRFQIGRGDVEFIVGKEYLSDGFGINLEFLGQSADFVREGNFYRVPGVADILHHFGGAEGSFKDSSRSPCIELAQPDRELSVPRADDCHGRLEKIGDGSAFPHELRIYAYAEVFSQAFPAGLLQRRNDDALSRARQ